MAVYLHLNQNKDTFGISNNHSKMCGILILLRLLTHVSTFIAKHIPTGVSVAFVGICCSLWRIPWSMALALVWAKQPLLTTSWHSRLPLGSMWKSASVVTAIKNNAKQRKSERNNVRFLNDAPGHRHHDGTMLLVLVVYISLIHIWWLTCKWEYSRCRCACKHLIWHVVLIRIRT